MDISTLNLVNLLLSIGFSVLITVLWLSQNRNEGIGYWVASEWVITASFLLNILYNATRGVLWVAVAVMGFSLAFTLALEALSYFRHSRSHARTGIIITTISSLAIGYIEAYRLAWNYRIFVTSGAWILLSLLVIWTLLEAGDKVHRKIYRIMAAVQGINILFYVFRGIGATGIAWPGPVSQSDAQAYLLLETIIYKLACDLGYAALILFRLQARLNYLARHDDLTEITNRRFFLEMAERELSDCQRKSIPAVMLLMDIDHFKAINDGHGHQAGDCVLFDFARLVRSRLRQHDIFGRLGGEEFAILLPDTHLERGIEVAERLRTAVQENIVERGGVCLRITMSIGVACFPHHVLTMDALMSGADKALYQAKVNGRNCVVVYSE